MSGNWSGLPSGHRGFCILRDPTNEGEDRSESANSIGSKGGIYFGEEPDLIAPLFRIALRVLDIVVIDEMKIFEVFCKRKICSHFDFLTRRYCNMRK